MSPASVPVQVGVVIPVRNEAGNIAPLIAEIEQALSRVERFEVICVDDGSTDSSADELVRAMRDRAWMRAIRHETSCGQSAAVRTGVLAAQAPVILTLDGDGQSDPAFMPRFLAALGEAGTNCGLVQGQRTGRKATPFKRLQSKLGNAVRQLVLGDSTRDTGCGFRCFPRDVYLALPYFDALHRFMPALVRREGYDVILVDVPDRPRRSGVSNYGFFDRLWVGMIDLAGVRWLIGRRRIPVAREVARR